MTKVGLFVSNQNNNNRCPKAGVLFVLAELLEIWVTYGEINDSNIYSNYWFLSSGHFSLRDVAYGFI